jgi:hypothetical protein
MAEVRVTQVAAEVARQADSPEVRVTQVVAEAARQADAPQLRMTRFRAQVLRIGPPPVTRVFPVPISGRSILTGVGTRQFLDRHNRRRGRLPESDRW